MTFDEIMKQITSGLTGDSKKDFAYLEEQSERYKNHELSREILRACGRLMVKCVPPEERAKLIQTFSNDVSAINSILEEAHYLQVIRDYEKAISIMEPVVEKWDKMLEEEGMFTDDSQSEYHCFQEPIEEYLYAFYMKSEKDLRRPDDYPFANLYTQYGSLLIDMKRIDEAQNALKKALRWNPTSLKILAEYAETFKMKGDMESFFKISIDGFKVAYTSMDLARCYRNIGFYFVEKKLWKEAIGCYIMSMQFDRESKNAQSELYYINDVTNGEVEETTMEEFEEIAEKYGFPVGPYEDVIGLAYAYGKHFYEEKMNAPAIYFFGIVYDLLKDEDILKMLESMPEYNGQK